jgi:anti-sigma factor RsiW
MMRTEKERRKGSHMASDRRLWQRARSTDALRDDTARFLDLAAFADGLLDADDRERVAVWLTDDPDAAADVSAARALGNRDGHSAELQRVIARACAIRPEADPARGHIVVLAHWRGRRLVQDFAQWGSIAAAVAFASWLGFSMGSDTSLALTAPRQPNEASFLPDLFDPAPAFLRDLGEGSRT